jgi:hypothetical protein
MWLLNLGIVFSSHFRLFDWRFQIPTSPNIQGWVEEQNPTPAGSNDKNIMIS